MNTASKILLVDDESAITSNLAPFLERADFDVEVAEDGETGLQVVTTFKPSLIVLDAPCKWARSVTQVTPIGRLDPRYSSDAYP